MKNRIFKRVIALLAMVIAVSAGAVSAMAENYEATQSYVLENPDEYGTNDELLYGFMQQKFYGNAKLFSNLHETALNEYEKTIYDSFVDAATKVANGEQETAEFYAKIYPTYSFLNITTETAYADMKNMVAEKISISKIYSVLLLDNPYIFYWHDKTQGISTVVSYYRNHSTKEVEVTYTTQFKIASSYEKADSTESLIDNEKTSAAKTAAENAVQIVAENEDKSDYGKLVAYKEKICELVSYNYYASSNGSSSVGIEPWQLIYVFDGDSSTNVVCEGYSKAFMYLCELSGINCYLVTGNMADTPTGTGGHMWNHVVLDGVSYLVDVTNCDGTGIGSPDKLFMKGMEQYSDTCYYKVFNSAKTIYYRYDDRTNQVIPINVLALSAVDYTEPAPTPTPTVEPTPTPTVEPTPTTEPTPKPTESPEEIVLTLPRAELAEEGDKWIFNIETANVYTDSFIYIAFYDEQNNMIGVTVAPLEAENSIAVDKNELVAGVKLFIWTDDMRPITYAVCDNL